MHRDTLQSSDARAPLRLLLFLIPLVFAAGSCEEDESPTVPDEPVVETRIIRDIDYAKNKFFSLDHAEGFEGATPESVELFREVRPEDIILDPTIIPIPAVVVPDPVNDGQALADVVEQITMGDPATLWSHDVMLLEPFVDYRFLMTDSVVTGVELSEPLPDRALKTLAVRYRTPSGTNIGGSYSSYGYPAAIDTLVLEMIKAPFPRPSGQYSSTWSLAIRNIYHLNVTTLEPGAFDIDIEDVLTPRVDQTVPRGSTVSYLQIFGLDVTDETGTGGPDGRIDPDRVDLQRGVLYFPDPKAFAPDPANVATWTDGQFAFTGDYQLQYDRSQRIYNEYLTPNQWLDVMQYNIRLRWVVEE